MSKKRKGKRKTSNVNTKQYHENVEKQKESKNGSSIFFIVFCIGTAIVLLNNVKRMNSEPNYNKAAPVATTEPVTTTVTKTTVVEENIKETKKEESTATQEDSTVTETTTLPETTVAETTTTIQATNQTTYNFMVYASGTGNTGKEETITTNIAVNGSVMGNNIAFNNVMTTSTIKDGFIAYKIVTNNDSVQSTDMETFNGTFTIADKIYNANIRVVHEVGSVTYLIQESEQIAKETIPETKKSLVSKYKDTIKIGD